MREDQIFVLLLIVLFPMSGCIDGGDAEDGSENQAISSTNHHPVIYGDVVFGDYQYSNTTSIFDVLYTVNYAHAIDFDGTITQFGIDTNQDGVIDLDINQSKSGGSFKFVNGSDSNIWKDPTNIQFLDNQRSLFCYQWISMIAVDDDGDISVKPFIISFNYDDQNNECLMTKAYVTLE